MIRVGCRQSNGDHTMFYKHSNLGKVTIVMVYVDDIIVTNSDPKKEPY